MARKRDPDRLLGSLRGGSLQMPCCGSALAAPPTRHTSRLNRYITGVWGTRTVVSGMRGAWASMYGVRHVFGEVLVA